MRERHMISQPLFSPFFSFLFLPQEAASRSPRIEAGIGIRWSLCPLGWQSPIMELLYVHQKFRWGPSACSSSYLALFLNPPFLSKSQPLIWWPTSLLSHVAASSNPLGWRRFPNRPDLFHVGLFIGLLIYLGRGVATLWVLNSSSCYTTILPSLAPTLGTVLCHMLIGCQNRCPDVGFAFKLLTI